MFNVFKIDCELNADWILKAAYTDTTAGWASTVEHCGNVLIDETTNGDNITRTYGVNSLAGTGTVAFYRPQGSAPQVSFDGWTHKTDFTNPGTVC